MNICPLCKGQGFIPFYYGLLRCCGCGLVVDRRAFTPQVDQQLNEDAFGEGYEMERSLWVRVSERLKNRRYLNNLRRVDVRGGRLLEIGVGSGSFLAAASDAGFEAVGFELSRSLAQRIEMRTGLRVHYGDLASLPKRAFDVVCMHHVLEHVSDPVGFLRAVRDRLAPGGVLHVAVPNIACLEARLPGWNCYMYYHLLYFDHATLQRALQVAGVNVVKMFSHESFSTWLITLARTALGIRSMETPPRIAASIGKVPRWWAAIEHPYRLVTFVAGVLTWPLRVVQGGLGYGDELIAIARLEE